MNMEYCPECGEILIQEEENLYVCSVCGYSMCIEGEEEDE